MPREGDVSPRKPRGGYQLIPAALLGVAWWCYREKLIRLADLRVWFAAWEMRARRCRRPAPLPRRFAIDELRGLNGLSHRRLAESLRRLEAAGLLAWSDSAIGFPASPEDVPLPDRAAFGRFLDRIPNHRRRLPVPRRILRLLAGGARPALIATILGHLLRCLYLKQGECSARGRVKASWIAEAFGVALRRVKEARRELIAMGWLIPLEAGQWALNRWGALIRINLEWSRLDGLKPAAGAAPAVEPGEGGAEVPPPAPARGPELAPPPPDSGPQLAPPDSDEEPLAGAKNQEPASGGPAGFYSSQAEEESPEPRQAQPEGVEAIPRAAAEPVAISPASDHPAPLAVAGARPSQATRAAGPVLGKPTLRDVVLEDLTNTGRLLDLYEQAVDLGRALPSEWGRLRFVAAAEHARIIGTKNPCGLFVRLVRGGLYHFATQDDEMAASVRLRKHLFGVSPEPRSPAGPILRSEPALSGDARLVAVVRAAAARARYRGDAFPLLKRAQPEWTRERWDQAVAELG
jgi:hypothetical protein